jgi:CheY-like chemotaxis protein
MTEHGSILIIDDKKSDAHEFERVLRSEGYHVETESTAMAGLARAKSEDFDVVLTGLHLSGRTKSTRKDLMSSLSCRRPNRTWL